MRSVTRSRSVRRATCEALEARQLLSVSPTPNQAWVSGGGGGNDSVAPGMSLPANAALWDGDPSGLMTGSQSITLTLSNLPSHTLLNGYRVDISGTEGSFTESIDGNVVGQTSIGGSGGAVIVGGTANEYPESTNLDHTSSSVTVTLTAQLSDESDWWQVGSSEIDVGSYVGVQGIQDGSMQPDSTPGIFRFTRSNNSGPASSDQPLSVYYNLDQPIGDVLDSDGNWVSSIDGTPGQFHGPTFDPGGSGDLLATIPAGSDHVDVSLYATSLLPPDGDMAVNGTIQGVPLPATQVGYTTSWGGNENGIAAINMANPDSAYWARQLKGHWFKIANTGGTPHVSVALGSFTVVRLHVPGSAGKAVTTRDDPNDIATIAGAATMNSDSNDTFNVSSGSKASKGATGTVVATVGGTAYFLDVIISYN